MKLPALPQRYYLSPSLFNISGDNSQLFRGCLQLLGGVEEIVVESPVVQQPRGGTVARVDFF